MSLSGFMKQINKANQMLSEKIGGAKGTEIDGQFQIMEKKTDVINRLVDDIRDRTNEYLQPNPASRAKLWTVNNLSKMRGQAKSTPYPQPEGVLGETMIKHGKDLGENSHFGEALIDMGESLRQMAGIKYALEDNIKQNFLDPLSQIKENDLKDVMHLRKKTESRRLDYDCKKRKKSQGTVVTEEELNQAEEKFEESKSQAEIAMNRLLQNELEQVTHLAGFAEGFLEYHSQCYEILKDMVRQLNERKKKISGGLPASSNREHSMVKKNSGFGSESLNVNGKNPTSEGSSSASHFYDNEAENSSSVFNNINNNGFKMAFGQQLPPQINNRSSVNSMRGGREPNCKALYDFEAENSEELDFKEGSIIKLIARLDDNWLLGEFNGRQGRFPITYVEVINPLP